MYDLMYDCCQVGPGAVVCRGRRDHPGGYTIPTGVFLCPSSACTQNSLAISLTSLESVPPLDDWQPMAHQPRGAQGDRKAVSQAGAAGRGYGGHGEIHEGASGWVVIVMQCWPLDYVPVKHGW